MTTERIRWGILGAGNIAQRFASDIRYSTTGTLVAVGSRSLEKAKKFAGSYDNVQAFDDFSALASSPNVDAIYIATPNACHAAHSQIAIAAGKAVLCEKPFASSAQEARVVASAAAKANVFCMEAMWTRFLPTVVALHEKVNAGVLGDIIHLEMSLGFPRIEATGDPITDPDLGGGVVPDLGVYGLSIAEGLLGSFELVSSDVVRSKSGSSRTAVMVLSHSQRGAVSIISVSHDTQLANTLVISGTKGRATLEAPFIQAARGHVTSVSSPSSDGKTTGLKARLLRSRLLPAVRRALRLIRSIGGVSFGKSFYGSGLQFEIDEVGSCIGAGLKSSSIMPLETSISVIAALDSVQNTGA